MHLCITLFLSTILTRSYIYLFYKTQLIIFAYHLHTSFLLTKGDFVSRVTITIPTPLHVKLETYAKDNDLSLSSTISKMAEIGLMVTENQGQNKSLEDRFTDIEKHCFKLMIQMNALLKN